MLYNYPSIVLIGETFDLEKIINKEFVFHLLMYIIFTLNTYVQEIKGYKRGLITITTRVHNMEYTEGAK